MKWLFKWTIILNLFQLCAMAQLYPGGVTQIKKDLQKLEKNKQHTSECQYQKVKAALLSQMVQQKFLHGANVVDLMNWNQKLASHVKHYYKLYPNSIHASLSYAEYLHYTPGIFGGNAEMSAELFSELNYESSDAYVLYKALNYYLNEKKDYQNAEKIIALSESLNDYQYLSIDYKPWFVYQKAVLYFFNKDYKTAEKLLKEHLEVNTQGYWAYYFLGRIYESRSDLGSAEYNFAKARENAIRQNDKSFIQLLKNEGRF